MSSASFFATGFVSEPRRWRHGFRPDRVGVDRRLRALRPGLAETVRLRATAGTVMPEAYCASAQLFVPLSHSFEVRVDGDELLCDLNHIGCLAPGAVTQDRTLTDGGIHFLSITVPAVLGEEIGFVPTRSQLRPAPPKLQRLAQLLAGGRGDAIWREEALLALLRMATGAREPSRARRSGASRLVARAKELLATSEELLSLTSIASAVGASPAYLTDRFRQEEGMPLARYQHRLRLARALGRLPETEDIMTLAMDLGFSSHSHFSAAFKEVYGVRPSEHRADARQTPDLRTLL